MQINASSQSWNSKCLRKGVERHDFYFRARLDFVVRQRRWPCPVRFNIPYSDIAKCNAGGNVYCTEQRSQEGVFALPRSISGRRFSGHRPAAAKPLSSDKAYRIDAARKSWSSFGQEHPVAGVALQKELLEVCERTSRAWLDRVKSDVDLWLGLVAKFAATGSIPELIGGYQKCVVERMQKNAEGKMAVR